MAVKETVILTRTSNSVAWPGNALPPDSLSSASLYSQENSVSQDELTLTTYRIWPDEEAFIEYKTTSTRRDYLEYIVNNNFTVTRTYEIV